MVVMTPEATAEQIDAVVARLEARGVHAKVMPGELTTAIGAIGDPQGVREAQLEGLAGVDQVIPISTQCYVVRVASANAVAANIVLRDRAATNPQASLTISASSPGVWGNQLAVVITNGTNDPLNEFNLSVFQQDELIPLERFDNLSMVPGASNFVSTATASSRYIRVTPNTANTNAQAGTSRGAAAPPALAGTRTRFRININGDGFQEVDLSAAVPTPAPDLNSAANIATAIQARVRALTKLRSLDRSECLRRIFSAR